MSTLKKYYLLETTYSLALSFTKATFVVFFLSHRLSHFEIGIIFGVFNLTVMLAEPVTAAWSEILGRRSSILIGSALKVIAAALFFYGQTMPFFILAEIVSGIALTFISGCIMAWAVDEFKKEGEKKSLYEIFAGCKRYKYSALIAGGLAGAFMGDVSLAIPWAANGVMFLVFGAIVFIIVPSGRPKNYRLKLPDLKKSLEGYKIIAGDKCVMTLISSSFLSSFALASIKLFWLPAVRENFNTSISFLGWMWVGIAGAGLLGSHFVKPFVKKFSYKLDALVVFSIFSTAFLFLMIYSIGSLWTLLFYFLFEFGKPLYSTVKSDLINYQISDQGRVTILSMHSLSRKLGTGLGLIVTGYLSDLWSLESAWQVSAGIFFLNIFLYLAVQFWMLKVSGKKEILAVV